LLFRALGLLCLGAALVVAGYYAWLLWGTGLSTARAQKQLRAEIVELLERPGPPPSLSGTQAPIAPEEGEPVAIIQIPRIGLDMVVVNGATTETLKKGPGHYIGTAYPWEERGAVAIAGHRTTYLHPFWSLDKLRRGDRITLLTEYGTFSYRVTGQEIIEPWENRVLDQTPDPTLVLTTCEPRFSSTHRLVVFAERE
jgi:sortase A